MSFRVGSERDVQEARKMAPLATGKYVKTQLLAADCGVDHSTTIWNLHSHIRPHHRMIRQNQRDEAVVFGFFLFSSRSVWPFVFASGGISYTAIGLFMLEWKVASMSTVIFCIFLYFFSLFSIACWLAIPLLSGLLRQPMGTSILLLCSCSKRFHSNDAENRCRHFCYGHWLPTSFSIIKV